MEDLENKTTKKENGINPKLITSIIPMIWIISAIFQPNVDDFAAEYASKYNVPRSEVIFYVNANSHMLPIPYTEFVVQLENGTDQRVGYGILGTIFITKKIGY